MHISYLEYASPLYRGFCLCLCDRLDSWEMRGGGKGEMYRNRGLHLYSDLYRSSKPDSITWKLIEHVPFLLPNSAQDPAIASQSPLLLGNSSEAKHRLSQSKYSNKKVQKGPAWESFNRLKVETQRRSKRRAPILSRVDSLIGLPPSLK